MKRLRCVDASWCSKNRDTDRRRYVLYATNSQVLKMQIMRKYAVFCENLYLEWEKRPFFNRFSKWLTLRCLQMFLTVLRF